MEATRYDAVPFKATLTPEGYLTDSPILARVGVQTYRDRNGREWREYRPPEAVFAPEHLNAIRGRPIIEGHIARVDAANARAHTIGTILSEGRQDGDHLLADIIIHDPSPVLKGGKRELSLGYRVKVRDEAGTTPSGERYDRIVEQIAMVDHLAIVPKGRAGVARLNLDADDAISITDEADMPDKTKVRLDSGLSYDAEPEVAQAFEATREALTAAQKRADGAEAERDTLKSRVDAFDAEKAQIRADAAAEARARMALEAEAAKHGVQVRADMADRSIREAVIAKVRGATEFANRSDDYVSAAFDMAVQDAKARNDAASQQRSQSNGGAPRQDADQTKAIRSAAAARDAMIRSNRI